MNTYEKGIYVMDFLQALKLNMLTIVDAVCDENLEKCYNIIKSNQNITKEEFLKKSGIDETKETI